MLTLHSARRGAIVLEPVVDRRGYPRSPVTQRSYRLGMEPANKGKRYPAQVLTREEVHRLMAALGRGYAGARNRALVAVMYRCGLRVAEALALYPREIDLDQGTVTVLNGKGGRRRTVGIDPQAGAVVQSWLDRRRRLGLTDRDPLFCVISQPTVGKPMHSAQVREALKDAARRAGLNLRVHPHGLRHTFASELAREGKPVNVIKVLLGHSSLDTTARYIDHLAPWEAIDAVRGRVWGPVSHEPSVDEPALA